MQGPRLDAILLDVHRETAAPIRSPAGQVGPLRLLEDRARDGRIRGCSRRRLLPQNQSGAGYIDQGLTLLELLETIVQDFYLAVTILAPQVPARGIDLFGIYQECAAFPQIPRIFYPSSDRKSTRLNSSHT